MKVVTDSRQFVPWLGAILTILCGGAWGLLFYFQNFQRPEFILEFVRSPDGHTNGTARATCANPSARFWLERVVREQISLKSYLHVKAEGDVISNGVSAIESETLSGMVVIGEYSLTFTPTLPLRNEAMLEVSITGSFPRGVFIQTWREPSLGAKAVVAEAVAKWYPQIDLSDAPVPANALRFYLVFSRPMTEGEIFRHIRLEDLTDPKLVKNVPGAFREVELWSPDNQRLTVWLHPGRQKAGVNLNEDEGAVLICGHRYRLTLDRNATTTTGVGLRRDTVLEFLVGQPDQTCPNPAKWKIQLPKITGTRSAEGGYISFGERLDWAMIPSAITIDGQPLQKRFSSDGHPIGSGTFNDGSSVWFVADAGHHFIEVSPDLEDMAGNNLSRPFEVDVSLESNARPVERKPVRIEFEVRP